MSAVVGYFDTVFAEKVQTKTLCVGNTCVTESQLQELMNSVSTTNTTNVTPDTHSVPSTVEILPESTNLSEKTETGPSSNETSTTTPSVVVSGEEIESNTQNATGSVSLDDQATSTNNNPF
jgi:hypothetical protein